MFIELRIGTELKNKSMLINAQNIVMVYPSDDHAQLTEVIVSEAHVPTVLIARHPYIHVRNLLDNATGVRAFQTEKLYASPDK